MISGVGGTVSVKGVVVAVDQSGGLGLGIGLGVSGALAVPGVPAETVAESGAETVAVTVSESAVPSSVTAVVAIGVIVLAVRDVDVDGVAGAGERVLGLDAVRVAGLGVGRTLAERPRAETVAESAAEKAIVAGITIVSRVAVVCVVTVGAVAVQAVEAVDAVEAIGEVVVAAETVVEGLLAAASVERTVLWVGLRLGADGASESYDRLKRMRKKLP